MTPLERLLAEAGTCRLTLDPLTADRSIRALGRVCGLLLGLELAPPHTELDEQIGEWREELAALRNILLLARRLSNG